MEVEVQAANVGDQTTQKISENAKVLEIQCKCCLCRRKHLQG